MGRPIIEIDQLSRQFGSTLALDDVNLDVPKGTVVGLVGENGAGKTTIIKHVLGLLRAKTGQVAVFGLNPASDPVSVLSRIGYLSEDRDMPDWMRVDELMRYSAAFFPAWDWKLAQQLAETFDLDAAQKVKTLSRGQRALTGLLVALAHRPELLVLDEPSSGLDPVVRRDILTAIIRTVSDEGRTVLFSSHLLEEVERVSDRVAMMHAGRLVLCDDLDVLLSGHHRLTLRFAEAVLEIPTLPGALWCTGRLREWTCICNGQLDELKRAAVELGAAVIGEESASLEDIFVARVKGIPEEAA